MPRPVNRKLKKEVREVVEWAQPLGWVLLEEKDSNNHWVLRHTASGEDVHLPCTPRNPRTLDNSRAKIRRVSGMSSDSGPAARYRHESRRSQFDMRSAAREAKNRSEERERQAAEHSAWQAEVSETERRLDEAMRALVALNPRRHPLKVRRLAARVVELEEKLEDLTTE